MAKRYRTWSRRIERNILAVYSRANDSDRDTGLNWYQNAHNEAQAMALRWNVEPWQAIGVIAAISPGLEWGRNLLEAQEVIKAHSLKLPIPQVGVYGRGNVLKAERILTGECPLGVFPFKTSPKVRAFYACILEPHTSDEVCVDRHAKGLAYNLGSQRQGAATNDAQSIVRPAEYPYLVWHYRKLAERLQLIPHQLQAITWVTWKRIQGNLDQQDIPF